MINKIIQNQYHKRLFIDYPSLEVYKFNMLFVIKS